MIPIEVQLVYKKQVGFTLQQKKSLQNLESYGINISQFIRSAVSEKIKRDWKAIKEEKTRTKYPF